MLIILNAFSFLREKLKAHQFAYLDAQMTIPEGTNVHQLVSFLGLEPQEVEAVFINHTVRPKETLLQEGDRVALLPPGTPGSYRLLLGLKKP